MTEQQERRRKKRSKSVSEVNDQLSTDPTSTPTWLQLGEVHLSQHNYKEALNCFETALSIESQPIKDKLTLIRIHLGEGSYQEARKLLIKMKESGWQNYRKEENN